MTSATILRAARLSSGLNQGTLAVRAGTSQPDVSAIESGRRIPTVATLEKLLRETGHRIVAVPVTGASASEAAVRIAKAPSPDGQLRAFLDFSDALSRSDAIDRITLALAEPPTTTSRAWDAALAAVVDYWLGKSRLPKPRWVDADSRVLSAPQSPQLTAYDLPPDISQVPKPFLRRNVLIERSTLESV